MPLADLSTTADASQGHVGSSDQLERMRRVWAMPAADTFDVPAIGAMVRKYLHGVSVDPFARNKRWATHTNDLNPATQAEHHMQAPAFLAMLADQGVSADVVLFDPPYSPRQVAECYAGIGVKATKADTQTAALYAACRREIRRLCKRGTVVLSFGWNTCGMGSGFRTEELLIVCHGAAHNDTLCLVERMHEEQMELRSNAPHEGSGADSSRTVPLDAVVGRHFTEDMK